MFTQNLNINVHRSIIHRCQKVDTSQIGHRQMNGYKTCPSVHTLGYTSAIREWNTDETQTRYNVGQPWNMTRRGRRHTQQATSYRVICVTVETQSRRDAWERPGKGQLLPRGVGFFLGWWQRFWQSWCLDTLWKTSKLDTVLYYLKYISIKWLTGRITLKFSKDFKLSKKSFLERAFRMR